MPTEKNLSLVRFGRTLKALRTRSGLSQEALANKAGLDRSYVGGVERGERNVSLLNMLRLAKALEIPVSEMVAGVDDD